MFSRRSFLASLASTPALLAAWRPAWAQTKHVANVTFVLFNDFYLMAEQPFPDGKMRGGFARLASVIRAERAKGGNVIVAHGGDTLSPSVMSGFDRGAHIVALTNMIGVDIFAPGNHEFDFGKAVFLQRMAECRFPLYAANMRDGDGTPLPGFKDRAILDIGGVRIGLTGLAYEESPRMSAPEDIRFASTTDTTKAQAAELRREGADYVVAVLHCNRGDALALQYAGAVDLMLTGHTHDMFLNFTSDCGIVESGYDAHYVTCIDVEITVREDNGRRTMTWWPQFRVIDTAGVMPDPDVAAAVKRFETELIDKIGTPIGTTAVELDSRTAIVRTREAAIGNLIADAMRAGTRADAALINGGGIRAAKLYQAGQILTHADILAELPFNNRVVVVELSGEALKAAIENGLSGLPGPAGRFPQVSGIKVVYDATRPPGSRIVSMQVDGAPLIEKKNYRVAILDFLARGGDDYTMLRDALRITPDNDAPLLVNELAEYIRRIGTVRSVIEGRVVGR